MLRTLRISAHSSSPRPYSCNCSISRCSGLADPPDSTLAQLAPYASPRRASILAAAAESPWSRAMARAFSRSSRGGRFAFCVCGGASPSPAPTVFLLSSSDIRCC
eukprot:scaffold6036_cov110-Isochrysis_galbana.AAC.3